MNEPFINPFVFYFIDAASTIKGVLFAIFVFMVGISLLKYIDEKINNSDKRMGIRAGGIISDGCWIKYHKNMFLFIVVITVLLTAIPNSNTMYKMLAAYYLTPQNVEKLGKTTESITRNLATIIIDASNQIEKQKSVQEQSTGK